MVVSDFVEIVLLFGEMIIGLLYVNEFKILWEKFGISDNCDEFYELNVDCSIFV